MMRWTQGRRILPAFFAAAIGALLPAEAFSIPAPPPFWKAPGSLVDQPRRLRVRIAEAESQTEVRGLDLKVFEPGRGLAGDIPKLAFVSQKVSNWQLHCQDGRIRATRVSGEGGEKSLDLAEPVIIESPAGFLQYRGRTYRDALRIYSSGSLCEVINEVDLEKYLQGLVNSEFNSRWKEEAIAAQVVAARTYALFQMKLGQERFDLDSTERDQVYEGPDREDHRAARVVKKTRGMVLISPSDGSPLKAFYHSTCGGETELPQNVWGKPAVGFQKRVRCPFCATSPRFNWSVELPSKELSAALIRGARNEGAPEQWPSDWKRLLARAELLSVQVDRAPGSNRAGQIRLLWKNLKDSSPFVTAVSGARLRAWIGPSKLLSANFTIVRDGDSWRIAGRGNGHGVGMCQWGAKVMGEYGYTMNTILRHYYPDAVLKKLW